MLRSCWFWLFLPFGEKSENDDFDTFYSIYDNVLLD